MRKPLVEKIVRYCRAGWWCPAQAEQAAPMLVVPKKNRDIWTVVNAKKRNNDTVKNVDDTQPGNPNKTPKMPLFSITRVRGRL
jgi:hypothetical protein